MTTNPANAREAAIKRLTARRDFWMHAVTYLVFNGALIGIWTLTSGGYFWPGWVIGIWGAALLIHAWDVWGRRPISEEEIRREVDRQTGGHA